jgi:thiosulfate/3-mercaptopyruvate sulfurtransferase
MSEPRTPLVTVAELAAILQSPTLLVVDCRHDLLKPEWGAREYAAGHVPGAVYANLDTALSGPRHPGSGRHPLPSPAAFAATLGSFGFTAGTRVVVYDQGNGAIAARLWWMLRSRGHQDVQLLDGGYAAWCGARLPCDETPAQRARTIVEAREFSGMVDTSGVAQGLAEGTIRLVDARAADRYAGRNETIDPVAGHIPGAVSHPFVNNLDAGALYLDSEQLRQRWKATLAGAAPERVVSMCGSGVTGCHNLLAMELAGFHGGRLYAGSFSEWIADRARPVATGTAP